MPRKFTESYHHEKPSIEDILYQFIGEEEEGGKIKQLKIVSQKTRKCLIKQFKKSERFKQTFNMAVYYILKGVHKDKYEKFRKKFAGKLYQDMVYIFLAENQPEYYTIWSPEETLKFYKKLYPNAAVAEHIFGLSSLHGITVPDGLLIKNDKCSGKIVSVCEYTLAGSEKIFENKFEGMEINQKHFPKLFDDASLTFVLPKGHHPSILKSGEINIIEMPITYKQFRYFEEGVYNHYQLLGVQDDATLSDFRERVKEQVRIGVERLNKEEELTAELMRHLSKMSEFVEKYHGVKTKLDYSILWNINQ